MVDGWGKRGEVRCEHILSLRKKGGGEGSQTDVQREEEPSPELSGELPWKKARTLSLDEYEAAFDEDSSLDEETLSKLP